MQINEYFSFDISQYAYPAEFRAGQTIIPEGSSIDFLIYIEKGSSKCVETQENGVISLIEFLSAPCFLGDLELIGERKSSSGIVALTDCRCQIIRLSECRDRVLNDLTFLKYLCRVFAKKTVQNSRNMIIGKSYPLKNRLATFILDMQQGGVYSIAHTEAAPYLGVSYRHLLYVLAQFADDGLLEKTPHGYRILNKKALQKLYTTQPD